MGMIRGILVVIISVLLFVMFIFGNTFLTLGNSLEYENIQQELIPIVERLEELGVLNTVIDEGYDGFVLECQNSSEINIENDFGSALTISCEDVNQGKETISEKIIEGVVDGIYYSEYDCGFFDCNKEGELPFFVVSEHSKEYFNSWFYKALFINLFLFIGLFFLVEKKSNALIISGALMIFASIPFAKLDFVVSLLDFGEFLQFFGFLFGASYAVFIKMLIFGIVLLVIGIVWKFFSIGFKIQGFVERFKKKDEKVVKPIKNVEKVVKSSKVVKK